MNENMAGVEQCPVAPSWQKFLLPEHYPVHLHALNHTLTRRLGLYLDGEAEDTNPNGVFGDFGGLAELIGYDSLEIQAFDRCQHKGREVLNDWKNRDDLNPTVGKLVEYLIIMGREDILTDLHLAIRFDTGQFLTRAQDRRRIEAPVQDQTVSQGPGSEEVPKLLCLDDILTGQQNYYDAFVCYNAKGDCKRDMDFVREMVARLEAPPFNLKLFVPSRDELAGLNEHKVATTIISKRCRHMIVVLSNNFLVSEVAEFHSSFAFSLSPSARQRRIVPVQLEECPIPNIMMIMARCDFTKQDLWDWSWNRLAISITKELSDEDFVLVPSVGEDEAMQETDSLDSAVGSSVTSMESNYAHGRSNLTAPVSGFLSSGASRETVCQRPFTTNFSSYGDRRTSPKSSRSSAGLRATPQKSGASSTCQTSIQASGSTSPKATSPKRSLVQRFSEKILSKKTKKPQTATTMF